jgi:glutamate dehydrogenase
MDNARDEWADEFSSELAKLVPAPARATSLAWAERELFLAHLPPGYPEETLPKDGASDWLRIANLAGRGAGQVPANRREVGPGQAEEAGAGQAPASGLGEGGGIGALWVASCRQGAPGDFRLRRAGLERVELSSLLPVLESFGLAAVEAVPWRFSLGHGKPDVYLDDIGLRVGVPAAMAGQAKAYPGDPLFASRLVAAVEAVLAGRAEENVLNTLVVEAGLDWREVNLLTAYRSYRQLAGGGKGTERAEQMAEALVAFPEVALSVVHLFRSRLVADLAPSDEAEEEASTALARALGDVPDFAHYEALKELADLVHATTRSNFALAMAREAAEALSLKLAAQVVSFLPPPRPFAEIYVWSPWFEGLHLRFGPVARGGVRWSDRETDLRSEVLGLARAQLKKNSLIVPTGAKGGFILRPSARGQYQAHLRPAQNDESEERGKAAYRAFISALLDITDNMVAGKISRREGLRHLDGDDPYLVVAADKGTAAFSDLANEISLKRGFWLGDAFASGGSHGYDHKALGITARGAWLAVRRHFRALGMDPEKDALRVVGVGDMSGDVFGNGMLQSRSLRLVAAFDHRHIFIDPDPDPASSYAERLRLQKMAGSSWADYDLSAASAGAGVFSRRAKQLELSPEACALLGLPKGPTSPPELVKAVLRAPVDLVYFGGVGTFVKAPGESDSEVDDEGNDEVRVTSDQLRARVVAEGANLAMTQRARVAYSRRGGRVNTDFVDNAAGVAMSDREVNLKILLSLAISSGRLTAGERDRLLAEAEADAATSVLATVEGSMVALDRASVASPAEMPAWERLMSDLSSSGLLDAAVEGLPSPEEISRRKQAGAGFSRPELAVLLAYARSALARDIEASPLVGDQPLKELAFRYFPPAMRARFADLVPEHPLFAQLISSELANEVLARMGGVWADEVAAELGCQLWQAAGAYWAASRLLGTATLGEDLDQASDGLPTEVEGALRDFVSGGLNRLARWYLSHEDCSAPEELAERDRAAAAELELWLDSRPAPPLAPEFSQAGELASKAAKLPQLAAAGEVAWVARAADRPLPEAAEAHRSLSTELCLPSLIATLLGWPAPERWQRWQLHYLADDLAQLGADAAARALREHPSAPPGEAVSSWLTARQGPLARAGELAKLVLARPDQDIALASVCVRALQSAVTARPGPEQV